MFPEPWPRRIIPHCPTPQPITELTALLQSLGIPHELVVTHDAPNPTAVAVLAHLPHKPDLRAVYAQLVDEFPTRGFWPVLTHQQTHNQGYYPWVTGDLVEPSTDLIFTDLHPFYSHAGADFFERPKGIDPEQLSDADWEEEQFWSGRNFPDNSDELKAAFFASLTEKHRTTDYLEIPEPNLDPIPASLGLDDLVALLITPVNRPTDVPAAVGWLGACNYDFAGFHLSSVLRSWEDRFGAVLIQLENQIMTLAVPTLQLTNQQRNLLALEHYFFCRDTIDGLDDFLLYTNDECLNQNEWYFWWD